MTFTAWYETQKGLNIVKCRNVNPSIRKIFRYSIATNESNDQNFGQIALQEWIACAWRKCWNWWHSRCAGREKISLTLNFHRKIFLGKFSKKISRIRLSFPKSLMIIFYVWFMRKSRSHPFTQSTRENPAGKVSKCVKIPVWKKCKIYIQWSFSNREFSGAGQVS